MGNRIGIGVAGLALLGGGMYVLHAGRERPGQPAVTLSCCADSLWLRSAGAVLAMLLALVATRWLLVALGWGRRGRRVGSGVAMLGVALQGSDSIAKMQVRMVREHRMRIGITFAPDADPGDVIAQLDRQAVSRVRGAVGRGDVPTLVRLHIRRR
jgi:hypothetical protein